MCSFMLIEIDTVMDYGNIGTYDVNGEFTEYFLTYRLTPYSITSTRG